MTKSVQIAVGVAAAIAVGATGLSVAAKARGGDAEMATTSTTGVGVLPSGAAWVVVGDSVEYCYLNALNVPVCQAARRYSAN
jgi:hypothetical protein